MIWRWILIGLGALAVLLTALPLIPSNHSLIRICDFPRIQLAVLLALVLIGSPFLLDMRIWYVWVFCAVLAGALAWQAHAIWPYTPLANTEVKALPQCDPASRITLLVANVLKDNRRAGPLLALVERLDPDLVLLVETDSWWDGALEPLRRAYPNAINHPQDNSYGLHLFSRLELIDPEVRFLIEETVPSIRTGIQLPSGARVNLYGLHPKPPPLQDTEERDAELVMVGREAHREPTPSIVAGDLNDVAWSRTNRFFRKVSGLLDPRIGRGTFATFNARWPLMRWPLDHVFFDKSFRLLNIAVKENIGSDHFPLFVALCHDPATAHVHEQEQAPPDASDVEEAEEVIEEGRKKAED